MPILKNEDLEQLILRMRELSKLGTIVIPNLESISKFTEKDKNKLNSDFRNSISDKDLYSSILSFDTELEGTDIDVIKNGIFIPLFIIPDFNKDSLFQDSSETESSVKKEIDII